MIKIKVKLRGILLLILILSPILAITGCFFLPTNITEKEQAKTNPLDQNFITNSDILSLSDGNFSGTGNPLSGTKFAQYIITEPVMKLNTSFEVDTRGWNATDIYINLESIGTGELKLLGETDFLLPQELNLLPLRIGQAFQIPFNTMILNSFSILLRFEEFSDAPQEDIRVEIWNATNGATPTPNVSIYTEDFNIGTGDPADYDDWLTINFSSPVQLKQSITVNDTFFISLSILGSARMRWWGARDQGSSTDGVDEFDVFSYNGAYWTSIALDLSLNTSLSQPTSASALDLKINNSPVTDLGIGLGTWNTTFSSPKLGTIIFTITANQTAFVALFWNASINLIQSYNTSFLASADWDYSKWNATAIVKFLPSTSNRGINFSVRNWNIDTVWSNETLYGDWSVSSANNHQFVTVRNVYNGTWTIACNSSNYLKTVNVKKAGISVETVNVTDTVEIYATFHEYLASGYLNLTVFPQQNANHNDTIDFISGNTSIKFAAWTINETATNNPGGFRCQVMWQNGTEVGINTTYLIVLNTPTNLTYILSKSFLSYQEPAFIFANFTSNYSGEPISGASLIVKNSTDGTLWPKPFQIKNDFLNGTYLIEIQTKDLKGGGYFLSINLSKSLFLSSEISDIQITISGGVSNISITAPYCSGLSPLNQSFTITDPAPYHNSSVSLVIYYYSNATLDGLTGGTISGSWIGTGPRITWTPFTSGYYNLTLDVEGFKSGTNHTIRITIEALGYYPAELYIIVPIRKLPTRIVSLNPSYSTYLRTPITISAVYEDTHNLNSIPSVYELNGNVTLKIKDYVTTMELLSPLAGIYQTLLDPLSIGLVESQNYNLTISAISSEHEYAEINVTLIILPRNTTSLTFLITPSYLLAGQVFTTFVRLQDENGTPIFNSGLRVHFLYQPGSLETQKDLITNASGIAEINGEASPEMLSIQIYIEYLGTFKYQNTSSYSQIIPIIKLNSSLTLDPLPTEVREGEYLELSASLLINGTPAVDQIVIFTITAGDDVLDIKTTTTNASGKAKVTYQISPGGRTINIFASYNGIVHVNGNSSSELSIKVINFMTLVIRSAPYWATVIAGIVIGTISYNYAYRKPKKKRDLQKLKLLSAKFEDLHKISYILFMLKRSGVPLYEYQSKISDINPVLIAGFFQAISSFRDQIMKDKGKFQATGWELDYENFKISLFVGDLAYYAILSDEKLSEITRKNVSNLINTFESNFQKELHEFKGILEPFNSTIELLKKNLELGLTFPHTLNISKIETIEKFSKIESAIIELGRSLEKETAYFYLAKFISTIASARGESELEILGIVYNLWKRGILIPTDPEKLKAKDKGLSDKEPLPTKDSTKK